MAKIIYTGRCDVPDPGNPQVLGPELECQWVELQCDFDNGGNIYYGCKPDKRPLAGGPGMDGPVAASGSQKGFGIHKGENRDIPVDCLGCIWIDADTADDFVTFNVYG